jgi:hypothetical protein
MVQRKVYESIMKKKKQNLNFTKTKLVEISELQSNDILSKIKKKRYHYFRWLCKIFLKLATDELGETII